MAEKSSNFLPHEELAKKTPAHASVNVNLGGSFIPAGPSEHGNPAVLMLGTLCVALSVVLFIYGGVLWYQTEQKVKLQSVLDKVAKVNADIADIEKKQTELGTFQNKLGNIKTALDNHIYVTKLLAKIEESTLPNVFYTNISLAGNMTVSLTAVSDNYTTLGKQLLAFQEAKEFVTSAQVEGANAVIGQQGETLGINFSMKLTVKPEVMRMHTEQKK